MKTVGLVTVLAVIAAGCDNSGNTGMDEPAEHEVTLCSCVNEPPGPEAKVKACAALLDSMTQEQAVEESMACRAQLKMPDGGPDLCFCIKTMSQDPAVRAACEAIMPTDMSRPEMASLFKECARR